MHTVIVMDKSISRWINEYKPLIDPFVNNGQVSYCSWNQQGHSVEKAMPQLKEILRHKKDWRVVFVVMPENIEQMNPFEVSEIQKNGDLTPLVRITRILDNVYEFNNEPVHLNVNKPTEIILISPRCLSNNQENNIFTQRNDIMDSSRFATDCKYASISRFLVYDIVNEGHIDFNRQIIGFVSSILCICINQISPSTLQAYRLYKTSVNYDEDGFCRLCSSFYSKLKLNEDILHKLNNRIVNSKIVDDVEYVPDNDLISVDNIDILIEDIDYNGIQVGLNKFGLTKNCPVWDNEYFRDETYRVEEEVTRILYESQIAVDKAMGFSKKMQANDNVPKLDKYQKSQVKSIAERECINIYQLNSNNHGFESKFKKHLKDYEYAIFDELKYRMTKKQTIIIGVIAILLYFTCFIPTIISMIKYNAGYNFLQPILIPIIIVFLLSIDYLYYLKRFTKKLVLGFNKSLVEGLQFFHKIYKKSGEIITSASKYTKCIEALNENADSKKRIIMKKAIDLHLKGLSERIKLCENWVSVFDMELYQEEVVDDFQLDLSISPKRCNIYYPCTKKQNKKLIIEPDLSNMYKPYEYINSLEIIREEIYND